MIPRFAQFPSALASQARSMSLGGVPAMAAHPDWSSRVPAVIWMHGRTVSKELDPGRYLRWIRAGIAAIALDLPGHGERAEAERQTPAGTLGVMTQMLDEVDGVVAAIASELGAVVDLSRLGIGGMSLGGMCTLRRLCEPHGFACAAVECTTGDLHTLYNPPPGRPAWPAKHDPAVVSRLNPREHLATWRPIPLLALHGAADRVVPVEGQRGFIAALKQHHLSLGAEARLVEMVEFPENGSPDEHAGFGKFGNDAKNAQVAFFKRSFGLA